MKTIFKPVMILLFISCSIPSFAQDTTKADKKIREYVLSLANLAPLNIAIKYKKQIKGKTFFKAELINLSASGSEFFPGLSSSYDNSSKSFSGGIQFGLEFRKNISGDFTFFHGPGIGSTYAISVSGPDNPTVLDNRSVYQSYNANINYSLGMLFHLKGHFFISAEVSPGIHSKWDQNKNPNPGSDNHHQAISFSFGNTFGLLSLVYRR